MNFKALKILANSLKSEVQGLVKMLDEASDDDVEFINQKVRICQWALSRIDARLKQKEDSDDTTSDKNSADTSATTSKDASGAGRGRSPRS